MNATHCYIGTKSCGCAVAFVVDDPQYPKDTAEAVAEFILDGYTISRTTIACAKISRCHCSEPLGEGKD